MLTVDARGLSCPEPMLQAKNALKMVASGEQFEVLVETVTSRENVNRMAKSNGCKVVIEELEGEDGYRLLITKP